MNIVSVNDHDDITESSLASPMLDSSVKHFSEMDVDSDVGRYLSPYDSVCVCSFSLPKLDRYSLCDRTVTIRWRITFLKTTFQNRYALLLLSNFKHKRSFTCL
jgi:hypothetical protein